MSGTVRQDVGHGPMTAAISDAMVRLLHSYTGRGPTSSWTTVGKDLIVCVMGHALTRGEESLVQHGRREIVLETRHAFQDAMRPMPWKPSKSSPDATWSPS